MILKPLRLLKFNILIKNLFKIVLLLLSQFALAQSPEAYWRYTVRPDDNLINLGKTHLINAKDWVIVQRQNNIKNPYRMPIGSVIQVPLHLVKQAPASAKISFVSGQAQWRQGSAPFEPLHVNQILNTGAQIQTNDNSKVTIMFADGTVSDVASNSQVTLDSMSVYSGGVMVDTKVRLQTGQIETKANPQHTKGNRMQVITPSAIAAVRGTQFRVSADSGSTTEETLEGKVVLAALDAEVGVDKGYGSLTKNGQPPSPPVAILPAINTQHLPNKFENLPIQFDLPNTHGAASWDSKVGIDASFNQLIKENVAKGNQIQIDDLADGQYYLSLRAKDAAGIAGYDASHTFTVNARPFQPEMQLPAKNSVIRDERPSLHWVRVNEAQLYALQIAKDAEFKNLLEEQMVNDTRYQVSQKLQAGQYYWRVASVAMDASGQLDRGPAINISQFTYKPIPPKPDLTGLSVQVSENRVFVNIQPPSEGFTYQVNLDNEKNNQKDVWQASGLTDDFDFLLKEYGKQALSIRYMDSDGVLGPAAIHEFYATPK